VYDASDMKPLIIPGPLHFEAEFRSEQLADKFNTWKFKQTGKTVEWEADNMIEGFEMFNKLTFFPKKIYPYRRPLAFLMRQYFGIKNTWFAPKPNPEGAAIP